MDNLKQSTLNDDNIVMTPDGYYRYVNHLDKLATTGFGNTGGLMRNVDIIRFDDRTITKMRQRYADIYGV